ncbi:hypothetical protein SH1V18_16310 [Vallitalea longa]|uniref:PHP domain-containing protein n=1 Tax=Vallitalea longa TaxID=2936439 RepID=A0A9W5YAK2_9FIRM|nr:PHP domain-containing protein [Vallitalea longa]GKX29151.1 hypothetical protein SH1V18_16310 [Vallitalea longa]
MYKYDLHVHTKETSPCGNVSAKDMIKIYKENGYSGVVVTDHYRPSFFDNSEYLTWDEKIDDYLKGYKLAYSEGEKYDIDVLLGIELAFKAEGDKTNDYLIYGITEELLRSNTDILELGITGLSEFCRENDLLLYQAHPLRKYCYLADITLLDGIEVHNGNPRHDSHNNEIEKIAKDNDMPMISGSDYHDPGDENRGGIFVSTRITTNEELLVILKSKNYTLFKG